MQLIKDFYNVTYTNRTGVIDDYTLTFLWSLTTAIYLPGGMIGAFSAGYLADRIGRCVTQRRSIFSSATSFTTATLHRQQSRYRTINRKKLKTAIL